MAGSSWAAAAAQATYRGSDEETADLLKYYTQFKGNMRKVRWGWASPAHPR